MDRMTMIKKARDYAYETVDGCSALTDAEYEKMSKLGEEEAIRILAHEFLQEAADYIQE